MTLLSKKGGSEARDVVGEEDAPFVTKMRDFAMKISMEIQRAAVGTREYEGEADAGALKR